MNAKTLFNKLALIVTNPDGLAHKIIKLLLTNEVFKHGVKDLLFAYGDQELRAMKEKFQSKQNNFSKKKKRNFKSGAYDSVYTDIIVEYVDFFDSINENRNHRKDFTKDDNNFKALVPKLMALSRFALGNI